MLIEIIGIFAGIFTTAGTVPQLIKAYRTKSVGDVSVWMFATLLTGVILWTVYGFMKMDWPIIITNGVSTILHSIMLYFYYRFGKEV